jgi:hypothetical protein
MSFTSKVNQCIETAGRNIAITKYVERMTPIRAITGIRKKRDDASLGMGILLSRTKQNKKYEPTKEAVAAKNFDWLSTFF